jgi:RNA-directed DNA polymerase
VKAFARHLRAQRDAYQAGEMTLDEIQQSLQSWIAHARHGNTYRLRQALMRQVIF